MEIINVTDEIIEINVTEAVVNIVTQTGAYPLPSNVFSVFGRVGNVVGQVGDYTTSLVTEGTNLYYTDARSRAAISENITGINYDSASGIFSMASGYAIATTASQDTWDAAYNDKINSASVTGTSTKTLTLNQQDGGTITASWSDADTGLTSVGLSMPAAFSVSGSPLTSNGTIAVTGSGTTAQYVRGDGTLASFPSLTGFVPYTGATGNVNLGTHSLSAYDLIINHTSGSGVAASITKGGNGEAISVVKTSGSGNAASITGGVTLLDELHLTTDLADAYIASASNWNTAYTNRITSASAPLSIAANAISISQANTTTNGFLSSTDWNTFNNKQAAGNYITALTGEATASGPGSASVTLTNSAVTGKVLTGLNITGGSVSATDSILNAFGKVQNQINGLIGGAIFQSVWNASTNTPTLTSSVGTKGYYYIVDVSGTTNLNGITDWRVGDWAIYDGTAWQKVDNTDAVSSVNGFTGAVSLTTANISEATNLYYTDARARAAITLTTTGTSGAATYSGGTLNIPQYQAVLTNPVTGTGTTNTLPKFTGTSAIGNSNITDTGSLITLGSNTTISNGGLQVGINTLGSSTIRVGKNLTGAVAISAILNDGAVQSDVTSNVFNYRSGTRTAASTFTLSNFSHFFADQTSIGAGSSITIQEGFVVNSNMTGATNNYGFRGLIPSGTNRWNLFMDGTAANYLAGALLVGTTADAGFLFRVNNGTSRFNGAAFALPASSGTTQTGLIQRIGNSNSLVNIDMGGNDSGGMWLQVANSGNLAATYPLMLNPISGQVLINTSTTSAFALDVNGTARVSGQLTANSFVPTSSTIPTNGMYLSGTNTLGFATNGTLDMVINEAGNVGIGNVAFAGYSLYLGKDLSGAVTSVGVAQQGIVASTTINEARSFDSLARTAAASFTLGTYTHYRTQQATLGAGSAITNQYGFLADASLIGATNNYGFYGNIPAATNRWNLYMNGTANNYLAGKLGIGSPTLTNVSLRLAVGISGSTTSHAFLNVGTILSDVTTLANYNMTSASTQAAAFTLSDLIHYRATQGTFGAGSTVTNQAGFVVESSVVGGTNNYGFQGNIPSGTNRWNLYMAGTAANYMAGDLGIGAIPGGARKLEIGLNDATTYTTTTLSNGLSITNTSATTNSFAGIFLSANPTTGNAARASINVIAISGGTGDLAFTTRNASVQAEKIRIKAQGQMRFVPLASDPSGAEAGDVYYNSTTNKLKVYNGTTWETITSL